MATVENDILLEFNKQKEYFDIELDGADLESANNLVTSMQIALFTDARSTAEDPVPNSKGWAGDSLNQPEESNIGSRLWTVDDEFMTQALLTKLENLARDALQIIIDQQIAKNITIVASFFNKVNGQVLLNIDVEDPNGDTQTFKYVWDQLKQDLTGLI